MSASLPLASLGGRVLAGIFGAASRLRPTLKPLHPRGECASGRIQRHGVTPATGVVWLDQPGQDDVLVRTSRAAGLPLVSRRRGLAIRVPLHGGGFADLLLATTRAPVRGVVVVDRQGLRLDVPQALSPVPDHGPHVLGRGDLLGPLEGPRRGWPAAPLRPRGRYPAPSAACRRRFPPALLCLRRISSAALVDQVRTLAGRQRGQSRDGPNGRLRGGGRQDRRTTLSHSASRNRIH